MDWSMLLFTSVLGFAVTLGILIAVIHYGIRYRNELPKLPIFDSIEALKIQREEKEAELEFPAKSDKKSKKKRKKTYKDPSWDPTHSVSMPGWDPTDAGEKQFVQ